MPDLGSFAAVAFAGIGGALETIDFTGDNVAFLNASQAEAAAKTLSHGLAGGAISKMRGGRFGHGFLASGATAAATPYVTENIGNPFAEGLILAMLGGTVSELSGGKFANGAVTAAMAYAFNQIPSSTNEDRRTAAGDSEEVVIGGGVVKIRSASLRGGEGTSFEMKLSIDAYDRRGHLVGWYDVEISALLGGPGIGDRRASLSASVYEFDAILKGPPIVNRHQIRSAFHGKPIELTGGFAVIGNLGVSASTFRIGDYHDPIPLANPRAGIGRGLSSQHGAASVDSIRFRPRGW